MKNITISANARETVGKRNTKDLRNDAKVPGVIYSNGVATHIFLDAKELKTAVYTPETFIVNLNVDGKMISTITRKVDFHPLTEKMTHIELLEVTNDKPVVVTLPLKMKGTPSGVIKGGKLAVKLRKISVKGIPSKLPDFVEVPVAHLELGQTIKVSDVDFGDLKIMTSTSAGIASVEIPRALRSATAKG
ncbi:MAG: 50S ribosomal protein L25 [Bacteroidia bacterium]|nr:50S ribosomal protein L25 [Bacteroidia bacterium]